MPFPAGTALYRLVNRLRTKHRVVGVALYGSNGLPVHHDLKHLHGTAQIDLMETLQNADLSLSSVGYQRQEAEMSRRASLRQQAKAPENAGILPPPQKASRVRCA